MIKEGTQDPELVAGTAAAPNEDAVGGPGEGLRRPLGHDALQRLRRYQSLTIPPNVRQALMSANLPGAPRELLHDTLPPSPDLQHASPTRRRHLRAFVAGVAAVMVVLLFMAWLARAAPPQPATASLVRAVSASAPLGSERAAEEPPVLPAAPPPPTTEPPRSAHPSTLSSTAIRPAPIGRPARTLNTPIASASASAPPLAPIKTFRLGSR